MYLSKILLLLSLLFLSLYSQNILGKVDKFDLPDLDVYGMKAKIDTGAKTSSLSCEEVIPLKNNYVKFIVSSEKHIKEKKYTVKPISRVTRIKSSNGHIESRYFIKTTIVIYNKTYDIETSLSSRQNMIYPLLIGRGLLKNGFVVDVSQKYLSSKSKSLIKE